MASYEDIRAYFDGSDPLQQAARIAAQSPIVTGFTLDIDPLWSHLYDIANNLVILSDARQWPGILTFDSYTWRLTPSDMLPLETRLPDQGYRRRDLHATVPEWEAATGDFYKDTKLKRLPLVLTIVHRPLRPPQPSQSVEGDDTSLLQQLVRTTRAAGVAIRIEERALARLAFGSGDKIAISPAKSGTLGGVLDDRATGVSYGITCSHVARTNDDVFDMAGNRIGLCTADTARVPLPGPHVCDPVTLATPNPIPSNGPDVNMLDCALISLSSTVVRPTISGVAQLLSPGLRVGLRGAVTPQSRYRLGSLCLSYAFAHAGQNFCFRDAIELVPQPIGVLGRKVVATQGDSGGWVLTDDQPPEWAGLFFGEDRKRGFAIRAKWVHGWAQQITGAVLTP